MKFFSSLSLALLSASAIAQTQPAAMKGMDMKTAPIAGSSAQAVSYQASGVVKAVDAVKGTVTLAHGPVKGLNWPAMTMTFVVKNKRLFDKLIVDQQATIDFSKQDADYVVSSVK